MCTIAIFKVIVPAIKTVTDFGYRQGLLCLQTDLLRAPKRIRSTEAAETKHCVRIRGESSQAKKGRGVGRAEKASWMSESERIRGESALDAISLKVDCGNKRSQKHRYEWTKTSKALFVTNVLL